MKIHTTKIQKGYVICLPKSDMKQMGFKEGELVVVKFNENGIMIAKAGTFDVINDLLIGLLGIFVYSLIYLFVIKNVKDFNFKRS